MPQCSICGKQIRPRIAAQIHQMADGPLLCRQCALKAESRKDPPRPVCQSCGEKIETRIFQRITRARSRGRMAPMLCKSCFLKGRKSQFPSPPAKGKSSDMKEWGCSKCGAPLEPEEVDHINNGQSISCEYCGTTLTDDIFK
ncbi:MAG: hypothetical protein EAX81_08215 [Candidatus Thorarchaeota archaeon]|nr:hypothetical protein [Candidatus Thorarchaeota archaeon]